MLRLCDSGLSQLVQPIMIVRCLIDGFARPRRMHDEPCASHRSSRRDAIRLGALACGGIALPDLLRVAQANASTPPVRCRSVIQISMGGGPSHIDMYDLKPQAPAEVRGEFRPIDTAVPGIQISEHLPLQAQVFDKLAVIRSGTHEIASHLPASHYIQTGHPQSRPSADNTHPATGAVVSRLIGASEPGLPPYVAVPKPGAYGRAAYLGAAYNPFTLGSEPNSKDFHVASLTLEAGMTSDRLSIRHSLLKGFDSYRRDLDQHGSLAGLDAFSQAALDLVTSERAAQAFRLDEEPAEVRERYGWTNIGQNCLLARRLVEAGVTYVTCLSGGGWDTHVKNFDELKNTSLPRIRPGGVGAGERSGGARTRSRSAGHGVWRVWADADDQPRCRTRSLAGRDVHAARRRRPQDGASDR